MNKPQVFRWKSDHFEIHQSEGSPYFWLMKATNREERIPFSLTEIKELRNLLDHVVQECEGGEIESNHTGSEDTPDHV